MVNKEDIDEVRKWCDEKNKELEKLGYDIRVLPYRFVECESTEGVMDSEVVKKYANLKVHESHFGEIPYDKESYQEIRKILEK